MSERWHEFERRISQLESDMRQLQQRWSVPSAPADAAPVAAPVVTPAEPAKRGPGRPKKAE